ncbi:hypothetical protein [Litoribacter populi]|uniref:hypothetical protein n=1 Tax=Litoribacter populi TaxID=2598460 RepID=UPI00117BEFCB|nr:hypothetical protein [Litoribacter populi]
MKNSVKNLLRGGVFALGATFAFAFTQPMDNVQTVWGEDQINGVVPVTLNSNEYICDPGTIQCLYYDEAMEQPVPNSRGQFKLQ